MRAPTNPAQAGRQRLRMPSAGAFTLIELLCVITIIGILASMLLPAVGTMQSKAYSITCANNLRSIGVSVQGYLQDHNQNFPLVETGSNTAVYSGSAQTMLQVFGNYGVTQSTLQCPMDLKQGANSSFAQYGNSYDWKPTLDDDTATNPLIYGRRMQFGATSGTNAPVGFQVKLSKVRQCFDDTQIHFGHMNALYADGHVVYFTSPKTAAH